MLFWILVTLTIGGQIALVAYWDIGSCGPYGDDYNWEWCDTRNGGPCKKQVSTSKCKSGIARLNNVYGNQFARGYDDLKDNYRDPETGCPYVYFANYICAGNYRY